MKKIYIITAFLCIASPARAVRYLVDKIDAVIMGHQQMDAFTELIMRSDTTRPNLLGQIITLEEAIQEACYYTDARRLRAVMNDEQVESVMIALQHAYNLTREGLEEVMKGLGYSVAEGRRQLGRMNTVNQLIEMRVTGNIFVTKDEIETYYKEHPSYHDGIYTLQRAVIPFSGDSIAQEIAITQLLAAHADGLQASWSDPFEIGFSEIASDKAAIHTASVGNSVLTGKTSQGFELYRLVARKEPTLKTLAEAYDDISDALRKPQAEILMAEYKEALGKKLVIEYV